LKAAITKDYIQWHAGPFNLQVEAMDSSLFDYSLDIATQLDRMFNKSHKTVLSQKDVPGNVTLSVISQKNVLIPQSVFHLIFSMKCYV
jgi:hypothetical protein